MHFDMVMFEPGGLSERASILSELENPMEAASIPAATQGLRRWVRWKRREELGVSVPDSTILMRGLHKLTRRILTMYPDLSFRFSLVRNGLLVDTLPTLQSVSQYSEHILAELEQMGQHVRKKEGGAVENVNKLKKIEEPFKEEKKEDSKPDVKPCRFYLTENGCRKGKQCRFGHDQQDDQRRCYSCGSTLHMVGSCPVKDKEANAGSPPKTAKMPKEVEDGVRSSSSSSKEEDSGSKEEEMEVSADEGMTSLLQDAQKMLKSLSKKSEAKSCLDELQNKLNQLKKNAGSLKALRLTQLKTMQSTRVGLLDSGATNPLRPLRT